MGAAPARFVWVVGASEDALSVNDDLIIDITLDPGEKVDASKGLVVPEGLRMLKSFLEDMVDGGAVTGNLIVTSDQEVYVDVREFKVEFTAQVGI
jgi:hypothetical protein